MGNIKECNEEVCTFCGRSKLNRGIECGYFIKSYDGKCYIGYLNENTSADVREVDCDTVSSNPSDLIEKESDGGKNEP